MKYGYARVSTDGQSVGAHVAALRKHGAGKVFREVASGAKANRGQLRRVIDQLDTGGIRKLARAMAGNGEADLEPTVRRWPVGSLSPGSRCAQSAT
jgi:hypothetical protein